MTSVAKTQWRRPLSALYRSFHVQLLANEGAWLASGFLRNLVTHLELFLESTSAFKWRRITLQCSLYVSKHLAELSGKHKARHIATLELKKEKKK